MRFHTLLNTGVRSKAKPVESKFSGLSEAQILQVRDILRTVGLSHEDKYGFVEAVKSDSAFRHNVMLWTEFENGTRFVFSRNPATEAISSIEVIRLKSSSVSEEAVLEANTALASALQ